MEFNLADYVPCKCVVCGSKENVKRVSVCLVHRSGVVSGLNAVLEAEGPIFNIPTKGAVRMNLEPCPFEKVKKDCGHHPYKIKADDGWYYIQCTCGARGPMTPRDMEAEAWNTCAQASEGLSERLKSFAVVMDLAGLKADAGQLYDLANTLRPRTP